MADVTAYLENETPDRQAEDTDQTPVQLCFPTIDLWTSLDSLLSHSTTSSTGTATMPRLSVPPQDLDESWASLDNSDFSRDDDLQSENTDAGSLVDLSSVHDTESATDDDEDDSHAEMNHEMDTDLTEDLRGEQAPHHEREGHIQGEQQQVDIVADDIIIMQLSQGQSSSDIIELEYSRSLSDTLTPGQNPEMYEKMTMTVSKQPLNPSGRPFNIAHYGAASTCESKTDILGKIGAAIAASPSVLEAPVYNILATEFSSPGARQSFADIIPSQGQITITDIHILTPSPTNPNIVRAGFKNGLVVDSSPKTREELVSSDDEWRPDLLVVQLSRDDIADDFHTANQVLRLAHIQGWPALVITKDPMHGLCPNWLYSISNTRILPDEPQSRRVHQPLDLDTFVMLDARQLNQHLRYLTDLAKNFRAAALRERMEEHDSITDDRLSLFQIMASFREQIMAFASAMSSSRTELVSSIWEQVQDVWSVTPVRQMLKDVLLSLAIMALGIYVVTFSQGLAQKAGFTGKYGTTAIEAASSTATVTATSPTLIATVAVTAPSTEPTLQPPSEENLLKGKGVSDLIDLISDYWPTTRDSFSISPTQRKHHKPEKCDKTPTKQTNLSTYGRSLKHYPRIEEMLSMYRQHVQRAQFTLESIWTNARQQEPAWRAAAELELKKTRMRAETLRQTVETHLQNMMECQKKKLSLAQRKVKHLRQEIPKKQKRKSFFKKGVSW